MSVILAVVFLLLAACRHAPPERGSSSFRVIELPAAPPSKAGPAEVAEPASRAQYREASIQEKTVVLPAYPARALSVKVGAARVGVHVVVGTEGRVADIRPSMLAVSITPPGFSADFEQAVEVAVRQWRFHPARAEYIETVTNKGFSYQRVTRTEMLEAEFDLVFTFTPSGKVEANGTR
jgi:outer membrane biosynthesis protein TonB